jgi:hypothetical protein
MAKDVPIETKLIDLQADQLLSWLCFAIEEGYAANLFELTARHRFLLHRKLHGC